MSNMMLAVVDDREDPTIPPVDVTELDVDSVVEAIDMQVTEERPLAITVYVGEGVKDLTPTSTCHPVGEGEGMTDWHLHLYLRPKRELTPGSVRAINRAIAREVWAIKMYRQGQDWVEAHSFEECVEAQTAFADEAPQALKVAEVG